MTGKLIHSDSFSGGDGTLDMANLPAGVYSVLLESGEGVVVRKILLQ